MGKTSIAWADYTFNPWRGCSKVSDGCANCYAEAEAIRKAGLFGTWGGNGKRVEAAKTYWRMPYAWEAQAKKAGRAASVFVGSLCDVFEDRPDVAPLRARLAGLVVKTPGLSWLLLTKRPQLIPRLWANAIEAAGVEASASFPSNLFFGTSIEDAAAAAARLPAIEAVPTAERRLFLSIEPLLGPVGLGPSKVRGYRYAFAIVGGESGPKARPCRIEWIRAIRGDCQEAGIPFFVKQLGARPFLEGAAIAVEGKGADPMEWPRDLRFSKIDEPPANLDWVRGVEWRPKRARRDS